MSKDGYAETDRELKKLERQIKKEYQEALKIMEKKANDYFKRFEVNDRKKSMQMKNGEITEKEYTEWRKNKILAGEYYKQMVSNLTKDLTHAKEKADSYINGKEPTFYAMGANYAGYEIEVELGQESVNFALINEEAVEAMIKRKEIKLPKRKKKIPKEEKWNMKKINSALLQGIMTGDSIPKLAKRLKSVAKMNSAQSIRTARTLATGSENLGHYNRYHEAREKGIKLKNKWNATKDSRTRLSHRLLDGEEREEGELFSNGCRFPGDPECRDGGEIYNCRCRLTAVLEGYQYSKVNLDTSKMDGLSYEEWKRSKSDYSKSKTEQESKPKDNAYYKGRTSQTLANAYEYHRENNKLNLTPAKELTSDFFNANYGNIDTKAAKAFSDGLERLSKKYDTPLTGVRLMNKTEYLTNNKSFAFVYHDYTTDSATMVLNNGKYKNYDNHVKRIKELISNNYCAQIPEENAEKYVVTHEFAHSLIDMGTELNNKTNWANANYSKIKSIRKEISNVYDDYLKAVKKIDTAQKKAELEFLNSFDEKAFNEAKKLSKELKNIQISKYSMLNADEFMAEAFAQYELGGNQNDYVDKIMDIINRNYLKEQEIK